LLMAKPDAAGSTAKKTEIIVARFIVDPFFRREGLGSDGCDLFNSFQCCGSFTLAR
jgi:hypothetical protein